MEVENVMGVEIVNMRKRAEYLVNKWIVMVLMVIAIFLGSGQEVCAKEQESMDTEIKKSQEISERDIDKDNFLIEDGELVRYQGEDENVVVPRGIVSIGDRAFSYCTSISSIDIPEGVITIGKYAFERCTNLVSVKLPTTLTTIKGGAFEGCINLADIKLPESVTSIGGSTFADCKSLSQIEIPEGVNSIAEYMFIGCSSLENIKIPKHIVNIGSCAFINTKWLEDRRKVDPLVIINGVLYDGKTCKGDVVISGSVKSIGQGAFSGCATLKRVKILNGVKNIGEWSFAGCRNMENVEIPESVTTIGDSAFYYCEKLTALQIGKNVTKIFNDAFKGCDALTIYCIKNSEAESYAKKNHIAYQYVSNKKCIKEAKIIVEQISYKYDGEEKRPTVIVMLNDRKLVLSKDYELLYKNNKNIGEATITITGIGNYTGTAKWKFNIVAQKGTVVEAREYKYKFISSSEVAFCGIKNNKTTKVIIPSVAKIGGKNFRVTTVSSNALKNTKVTSVTVGANVKTIGSSAFAGCNKLKAITIKSKKIKTVGKNSFRGIKSTSQIKVPSAKLKQYRKLLKGKGQGSKVKIVKM